MNKFLKMEMKRSRRFLIFITIFSALFSIIINFVNYFSKASDYSLLISFYVLLGIILLINLIYFVNRYRMDIFAKSAYLTFTINLSTAKIMFVKFISGVFFGLLTLVEFVVFFLIGNMIFSYDLFMIFKSFNLLVAICIMLYWSMAYVLLLLGVSLSKVKIFNKYYEFVTIVLSIVVYILILWLMKNLYTIKAIMLSFKSFALVNLSNINGIDIFMLYYDSNNKLIGINVWMLLICLFVIVFGFFVNIFLLEEKIDL